MLLDGTYPPDARVRKEIKALRAVGHEVRLVCSGDVFELEHLDGVRIRRLPFQSPFPPDSLGDAYSVLRGVYPVWKREIERASADGVDVFHVHDLVLARTALQTRTDRPVVLDLHENYPAAVREYRKLTSLGDVFANPETLARRVLRSQRHWNHRLSSALQLSDHVLAVVPEARDAYIDCVDEEPPITVVSNTVDIEWFDTKRDAVSVPSTDGLVLTYAGTLSGEHRGIETAIEALDQLRQSVPDARLRLVGGRSTHKARLEDLVRRLDLGNAVEFTGWVEERTIPAQIAAGDIGLVPHRSTEHTETTVPHKLFQYMAAGLPVLATETSPVARVVRETDSGILVSPDDPTAMATAAEQLVDQHLRRRYGRNARAGVESKYNWERDGSRLQAVYNKLDCGRNR